MVVCILSMLIMDKYPSRQEATALVVLTLGVMLAVWQGAVTGKPYAVFFCIAGTVCNGAMMTFSNKLLRLVCGRPPAPPRGRFRRGALLVMCIFQGSAAMPLARFLQLEA